jgi:hypothetical protein
MISLIIAVVNLYAGMAIAIAYYGYRKDKDAFLLPFFAGVFWPPVMIAALLLVAVNMGCRVKEEQLIPPLADLPKAVARSRGWQ